MIYRVILTFNGEYKSTLYRCKTRKSAFIKFHKIKEENKVLFPKKFVNDGCIKPIKYEIKITKITEETDTFRTLRNDYGKTYVEKPLGEWTILHSDDYEVEETFWIFGLENRKNRPTIKEVVKRIMDGAFALKKMKQIIVVHNKLVIYNEEQFDMVICKNIYDAQRLHHTLAKIAKKQKFKGLLFMGTASKLMVGRMYDLIVEKTGWKIQKVRRTSTRP